jgi:hypothetical protein
MEVKNNPGEVRKILGWRGKKLFPNLSSDLKKNLESLSNKVK